MADGSSRFASISDQDIEKIQENAIPQNTKKATKFGFKSI